MNYMYGRILMGLAEEVVFRYPDYPIVLVLNCRTQTLNINGWHLTIEETTNKEGIKEHYIVASTEEMSHEEHIGLDKSYQEIVKTILSWT